MVAPTSTLRVRTGRGTGGIRVLIVENVAALAAAIQSVLQKAGMQTEMAASGAEALALDDRFAPGIVLVDLDLPDIAGLDLVHGFATAGRGVIAITDEATRPRALENGADDCVVKPLALLELLARIKALHRRTRFPQAAPAGTVAVDHARHLLTGPGGRATSLSDAEYLVLNTLLEAGGASVSRDWLCRVALKRTLHAGDHGIDQLVHKLRRKLADHGAPARTIRAVRAQGYVIGDPTVFHASHSAG